MDEDPLDRRDKRDLLIIAIIIIAALTFAIVTAVGLD